MVKKSLQSRQVWKYYLNIVMQRLNKTSNRRKRSWFSSEPFLAERHRILFSKRDSFKGEASTLFISSFFKASSIAFASSLPYPKNLTETSVSLTADDSYFLPLWPDTPPWGAPDQRASLVISVAAGSTTCQHSSFFTKHQSFSFFFPFFSLLSCFF